VRSRHEAKIETGAAPYLGAGEEVRAAFLARPRGWTQRVSGVASVGARQVGRAFAAGEAAAFGLASPMALALTGRRLLSLRVGAPIGLGIGGAVRGLAGAVPLAAVDAIAVQRLLLGSVVTVTVRGVPVKLEANALAGTKRLARAFAEAKAAGVTGATFACAVCGRAAGSVWMLDGELRRDGVTSQLRQPLSAELRPRLAAPLAGADARALHALDPELAPFYCPECDAVYCAQHWARQDVFEGDWHDAIRGRCPEGHERMLED
jgi:hypothetical protein